MPTSNTFVPPDTDMPASCDPFFQDCDEGEKCVPYGSTGGNWDANKCVPVTGEQAVGEACIYDGIAEGTDDCDANGVCWNLTDVDGELHGTCHAFCLGTVDDPVCPDETTCRISAGFEINVCMQTCDPLTQDCGEGIGCFWDYGNFVCEVVTEGHAVGEPCGFINDCAAGSLCLTAEVVPDCDGSACCGPLCQLGLGDEQCAELPGTTCMPFFEEGFAPEGHEDVGVCIL